MSPPQESSPPRSRSPDEAEGTQAIQPRRTRSSNDEVKNETTQATENPEIYANDEEEDEEEEEETRCVCGQLEYPGLPVLHNSTGKSRSQVDSDPISDDGTGYFIQCDECLVWQHGGCIGIFNEKDSPDKYFCEQCRKDLHEVLKDLKGRKYSRYLPVQESHSPSPTPASKSKESSKRVRDRRPSRTELDALSKGRRATMNSRDSAYDEAEQLRRAIEESKKESMAKGSSVRKTKRGRSESEERDDDAKRRRTTSGSSNRAKTGRQEAESEEELLRPERTKNARAPAARNPRAKELRDREVRDRERGENGKRKAQSSRRKGDDPDPSPEPPLKQPSTRGAHASSRAPPASVSKTQKKGGRPPTRKGRLGRNQYSKDRDLLGQGHNVLSPHSKLSPDGEPGSTNGTASTNGVTESNGLGKPSRPRHMNPNRTTMNDMKRRVAGILEFISHTQVEMAGLDAAKTRLGHGKPASSSSDTADRKADGEGKASSVARDDVSGLLRKLGEGETIDEDLYGKLASVEMMEVLTRHLMRWQSQYGKHGEK